MAAKEEKVPAWVEGFLMPTIESRTRPIVREEFSHFKRAMNARFDALDEKFDALFRKLDARTDRLE